MNLFYGRILPDKSAVIQGRLVDKTKTLYLTTGLDAITYRVVKITVDEDGVETGTEVLASTAITVADVVFNTPFTWDGPSGTANFRHVTADDIFDDSDTRYQIQYTFESADGTIGGAVVEVSTVNVL